MVDKTIFTAFNNLNVLIVGDVMVDSYLFGEINRMSPEAPVPVVAVSNKENRLGGAANVALNIKAMGANPILCSIVGNDQGAEALISVLKANEISTDSVLQSKHRKTTVKTRIFAKSRQIARFDEEDTFYLNSEEESQLLERVLSILETKKIDAVLFQDYNKGVLTLSVIKKILNESNSREIPTAVDPKNQNFFTYQEITLFKPNLREVKENLPQKNLEANQKSLRNAAKSIRDRLSSHYIIITLSDKGIYLDTPEKGTIIPTNARDVADVCGAGDTVISIVTLGLALNLSMEEVARIANLAGGQVCEHVGVVPVNKSKLEKEYILTAPS